MDCNLEDATYMFCKWFLHTIASKVESNPQSTTWELEAKSCIERHWMISIFLLLPTSLLEGDMKHLSNKKGQHRETMTRADIMM